MAFDVDTEAAASTLNGTLTTVAILWTLQSYLVWRAIERPGNAPRLGFVLILMTIVAALSTLASLGGLHLLTAKALDGRFALAYYSAIWSTVVFLLLVTAYYVLSLIAFIWGRRVASKPTRSLL